MFQGYRDANTCGGDSGGGLYCYDKSGSNYYYMGPLHGGNKACQRDTFMYFTNINFEDHRKFLQEVLGDSSNIKDEL